MINKFPIKIVYNTSAQNKATDLGTVKTFRCNALIKAHFPSYISYIFVYLCELRDREIDRAKKQDTRSNKIYAFLFTNSFNSIKNFMSTYIWYMHDSMLLCND